MRTCNVCRTMLPLLDFHAAKNLPLGKSYTCKPCANKRAKAWNTSNKIKKAQQSKQHYNLNKEAYLARAKNSSWSLENPERMRELSRIRYQKDPSIYFNTVVMRRKSLSKATPSWLSTKQKADMLLIYKLCARVTKESGKSHHVDHIVPIRGKDVCGLHVPWNLRVIPATMNLLKGNQFSKQFGY